MTFFLDIQPTQVPFDLGVDDQGYACVVFNLYVLREPSAQFIEELVKVLEDADVGTFGKNIFASSLIAHPTGDGPFLTLVETGGAGGIRTQNSAAPSGERATASVTTRAKTYKVARSMARAAYDAFSVVRNQTVTP